MDKDPSLSWGKIHQPKMHLSMGALVIQSPMLNQHFVHACSKLSFKAEECIGRSGIFTMVVEKILVCDGVACETETLVPTDSVSWEKAEQEGATGLLLCAFTDHS